MYEKQCTDLCQRFHERGYVDYWIKEARARFENTDKKECLVRTHLKPTNNRLSCIIQYSSFS